MDEPKKKSNIRIKAAILWLLSFPFWLTGYLAQNTTLLEGDYDWAFLGFVIFMVPVLFLRCDHCKTSFASVNFGPVGQGGFAGRLYEACRVLVGKRCPKCGMERK